MLFICRDGGKTCFITQPYLYCIQHRGHLQSKSNLQVKYCREILLFLFLFGLKIQYIESYNNSVVSLSDHTSLFSS